VRRIDSNNRVVFAHHFPSLFFKSFLRKVVPQEGEVNLLTSDFLALSGEAAYLLDKCSIRSTRRKSVMLFMENVVFSVFENDVATDKGLPAEEKKDRRVPSPRQTFQGFDRRAGQGEALKPD
jgi:hypothetical protein